LSGGLRRGGLRAQGGRQRQHQHQRHRQRRRSIRCAERTVVGSRGAALSVHIR
jgi:hypothetical protein